MMRITAPVFLVLLSAFAALAFAGTVLVVLNAQAIEA
jgi:hypothetical protein